MEQWKDIKGYEGRYQVSDLGRVRSLNYHREGREYVLVGCNSEKGYLLVNLYKGGKKKMFKVHRLVAEAFIPNPNGLPCVNHRDECKTNNIVTNLEWCDMAYNNTYGTRAERVAKVEINHPNTSKTVYQYTKDCMLVKSYPSTKEAQRQTGYNQGNISACCCGKYKTMYGFIWSYTPLIPEGQLF